MLLKDHPFRISVRTPVTGSLIRESQRFLDTGGIQTPASFKACKSAAKHRCKTNNDLYRSMPMPIRLQ